MTDTKEEVKFFKLVNGENIVASSYENFEYQGLFEPAYSILHHGHLFLGRIVPTNIK